MGSPSIFPISTASFRADTFNWDSLLAGECISQSAKIAGSLGVLKRGTVLFGPTTGPIVTATLLTTVPTGATARVILAADIDTTGGAVVGLVYTQGKFLDTAMTFSSNGAASDCAALWDFGVYVLTVEQRSGILVPMTGLPVTGGPLPQAMSVKDTEKALKAEVESIKGASASSAALPTAQVQTEPAWAIAAYGEPKLTDEQKQAIKTAEAAGELETKQAKTLQELEAKQAEELGKLQQSQRDEREKFIQAHAPKPADHPEKPPASPPPANAKK